MGLGDADVIIMDEGGDVKTASFASCSVCLEAVTTENRDRSWAKLECGHEFHLDCIGSAFNIKGAMQCPNCRKIEKGQWLYASGCRPHIEFNMEDWARDENLYDLSYSEMSFGVHWCPFSITRPPSLFDEGEFSSTAYHDLLGQHAIFTEHTAVSSASHSCPYVAYLGPVPASASNSIGSVNDGSNFNSHWNSLSAPSEIPTSYVFPSMDAHYHSWEQHSSIFPIVSSRTAGHDQPSTQSMAQRAARTNSEVLRSGSFVHPFVVGHGQLYSSTARAGSSVATSTIPPYPGSAARARDRVRALQAYFQHPSSTSQAVRSPSILATRRSNGHQRSFTQVGLVATSSDQASGFYFFPSSSSAGRNFSEAEHPMPNRYHSWERDHFSPFPVSQFDRDPIWGPPSHQHTGGSDYSGNRSGSFRQRHGADRMPSRNQ